MRRAATMPLTPDECAEDKMTMLKFVHTTLFVMPALVAGIHALRCGKGRRGWPEQVRP
jgi:hypothetical protein